MEHESPALATASGSASGGPGGGGLTVTTTLPAPPSEPLSHLPQITGQPSLLQASDFDHHTDDDLRLLHDELQRRTQMLTKENDLFARFYDRNVAGIALKHTPLTPRENEGDKESDPSSRHASRKDVNGNSGGIMGIAAIAPTSAAIAAPAPKVVLSAAQIATNAIAMIQQSQSQQPLQTVPTLTGSPSSQDLGSSASPTAASTAAAAAAAPRSKRGDKQPKNKQVQVTPLTLNADQKIEIAIRELEEWRDELEARGETWTRSLDAIAAEIEQVELSEAGLRKSMYDFKRDIIQGAIHPRTGKVMAERMVRYYEERLRNKAPLVEKLRLKNAAIRSQKYKLHQQLTQKEELGHVLHAVDFDQLQIENRQYLTTIEERNRELVQLKMRVGKALIQLNHHKARLASGVQGNAQLEKDLAQRTQLLASMQQESETVAVVADRIHKQYEATANEAQAYQVPQVMDYLGLITACEHLSKTKHMWSRKVSIAEMQANAIKAQYRAKREEAMGRAPQLEQRSPLPRYASAPHPPSRATGLPDPVAPPRGHLAHGNPLRPSGSGGRPSTDAPHPRPSGDWSRPGLSVTSGRDGPAHA